MSDSSDDEIHGRQNTNSSFTPSQLNLGMLVDNPTDDLFDDKEKKDSDDERHEVERKPTTDYEPRTMSQPQMNYNVVDNDDLESVHGDRSVVMSDDDNSFPRDSSDDESYSRKSYSSGDDRRSRSSYDSGEDNVNRRRRLYIELKRYCKRNKLEFPSHLHQDSPYHELKSYLAMLRSEKQMEQGVEMCKKVLVGITGVFEYLNTRFDPIGLKLEGFSENVSDNRDELTEPLEEIYEKHADKFDVPPGVKILMIIGGAAAQTHMMNSMTGGKPSYQPQTQQHVYKSAPPTAHSKPSVSDPAMDDDPDIQDILREMNNGDTRSRSSLSSSGTTARRKRANARVSLDDL